MIPLCAFTLISAHAATARQAAIARAGKWPGRRSGPLRRAMGSGVIIGVIRLGVRVRAANRW